MDFAEIFETREFWFGIKTELCLKVGVGGNNFCQRFGGKCRQNSLLPLSCSLSSVLPIKRLLDHFSKVNWSSKAPDLVASPIDICENPALTQKYTGPLLSQAFPHSPQSRRASTPSSSHLVPAAATSTPPSQLR
jgi:hypothetical protein